MSEPATLEAAAARIDLLGRPLLARLDLTSSATHLALLGDWSALFRLLGGEAVLAAGSLHILGSELPLAVQTGKVGLMRLDPQLPAAFSGELLLRTSAELAGFSRQDAARVAFETLDRLSLVELGARKLGHLASAERRCLLVAHALLTSPQLLCLEEPLRGLDPSGCDLVRAVIERAVEGRRSIIAFAAPLPTEPLFVRTDEKLRLVGGVVLPEGAAPAPTRMVAAICRNHHAFAEALAARGLSAHATHEAGLLSSLTSPQAGPAWRYLIELGEGTSAPILDAALETDAGLLELLPA